MEEEGGGSQEEAAGRRRGGSEKEAEEAQKRKREKKKRRRRRRRSKSKRSLRAFRGSDFDEDLPSENKKVQKPPSEMNQKNWMTNAEARQAMASQV